MSSHWNIEDCDGHIRLAERGPQDERENYTTIEFVDEHSEVELDISVDEHEDYEGHACAIDIIKYHLVNKETDRAFHTHAKVYLNNQQLRLLHAYLGFLLEYK
jgi:hypothetical protein